MSQTKQRNSCLTRQMLEDELDRARIRRVNVTADMLALYLDSRRRARPSAKTTRSLATAGGCTGPTLDKYVSVRSILLGRRSAEQST